MNDNEQSSRKLAEFNLFAPSWPHAKQQEVLSSLDSGVRFVMLRAGRKWRKTSLMISWLFEKAMQTELTCAFIAPNRIQAKNIVWDDHIVRITKELTRVGIPFKSNESELSVEISNAKVQLYGVENKEAMRGISNWGAVCGDEYDDWQEDIWQEIIRPNLITHKAQAIIGGTPKGFHNLWKLEHGKIFKPFHFTSYDNPDLDPEELQALEKEYKEMGMGTYRQEILAEYEKPEGTVYAEWNMDKQYRWFTYDKALPIHITWDFGVNDPTALIIMQPFHYEIRVVDYYEAANADLKHFTDWIDDKYPKAELETGDIAGRARSLITNKSVVSEARRLGHHIRTMPIPDIDTQIRNAHRYIGRLYVSNANPNTERFVECILNYKYPKKPTTLIDQTNEKPIHDEFSHGMRAFEYYCWNRSEGKVGEILHTPQRRRPHTAMINSRTGKEVSIRISSFEETKAQKKGFWN
jgi:hypothetical protein